MPQLPDVFPELSTSRLQLIAMQPEHIRDLYRLLSDERVNAFYPVIPLSRPEDLLKVIDMFANKFSNKEAIRWGITLKDSSEIIGTIGYTGFTAGHKGSIVYALRPELWGRGLMQEAIKEVTRFGFKELELERIDAEVLPGNTPSERLLEKLGFRHEGLLRRWMNWRRKLHDVNMWALLRAEA
jgi:ribosomal-protein-alanine N-acetyltransferase